jgi:transposase
MTHSGISLYPEQEAQLRRELKLNSSVGTYRRAAALLAVHNGSTVIQVAELLGVPRRTVYGWIASYRNVRSGSTVANEVVKEKRLGRPTVWTPDMRASLGRALEVSPQQFGHEAGYWSVSLLREQLAADTGKWITHASIRHKLKSMGYVRKRYRFIIGPSLPQPWPSPGMQEVNGECVPRAVWMSKQDELLSV